MKEGEPGNAEIVTIVENESILVRGNKIDQRRYSQITRHMKYVRTLFVTFEVITMTASLIAMVIMIFIHSTHSTIQNETDRLLYGMNMIYHAWVDIIEESEIIYESREIIRTKIRTYGAQSCWTALLKSTT